MEQKISGFFKFLEKRTTSRGWPKFSKWVSGNFLFHLILNRNFRKFWSNGTCSISIGLLFGERLDTLFTSSDSKLSGFNRPHVIGFVADLFFYTLESGFIFFRIRCRICRMRVDGSRIRKEKVEDSKKSGYVWTGPKISDRLSHIAWFHTSED